MSQEDQKHLMPYWKIYRFTTPMRGPLKEWTLKNNMKSKRIEKNELWWEEMEWYPWDYLKRNKKWGLSKENLQIKNKIDINSIKSWHSQRIQWFSNQTSMTVNLLLI